jgi:hypothetical protein
LHGWSAAFRNQHNEKNIIIDRPIIISYEIYRIGVNSIEELMSKYVFESYIGELPPFTASFHKIPYSGWKATKGQYRVAITSTANLVYYSNGEMISNTLQEIARYQIVERMITVT